MAPAPRTARRTVGSVGVALSDVVLHAGHLGEQRIDVAHLAEVPGAAEAHRDDVDPPARLRDVARRLGHLEGSDVLLEPQHARLDPLDPEEVLDDLVVARWTLSRRLSRQRTERTRQPLRARH